MIAMVFKNDPESLIVPCKGVHPGRPASSRRDRLLVLLSVDEYRSMLTALTVSILRVSLH